MSIQRVIIGTSRFRDLAGSEVTTLELAEALRARGAEVWIASFEFGGEVSEAALVAGCRFIDLSDKFEASQAFDLAWVHHAPTYYAMFLEHRIKARKIIFSSLSHFEPLESPPISLVAVTRYLANSDENAAFFREQYPSFADKLRVFPNAAPRQFWSSIAARPQAGRANLSLAVVSNHPPDELRKAVELAQQQGIEIQYFGHNGEVRRVTPDLLARFDGVVSIGKTVQYCLAMRIPIYCYDHFGGPGWINSANFDSARTRNFSGRCCRRVLTPAEIVQEWSDGFAQAQKNAIDLHGIASALFDLDANLDAVLSEANASESTFLPRDDSWTTEANILKRQNMLTLRGRRIEQELRTAWTTVSAQNGEIQNALQEMSDSRYALESLLARDRAESEALVESLQAELSETLGRERDLTNRERDLVDQLDTIKRSFSWRATEWLRNTMQLIRMSRTNRN